MTKHAKELPEDSFFHLMLQCMLGRAIAMATEKCKLALCNVFAELLLPDVWKITKLQGSYMNELTEVHSTSSSNQLCLFPHGFFFLKSSCQIL